jgi:hypothetical protein
VALYQNINGVWTLCSKPYVRRGGAWVLAQEAWVNDHGVWKNAYDADVTPPNPPEITLAIVEDFDVIKGQKTLKSRWIQVGTRLPGTANDDDARLIRMLTTYGGKAPTTQFGGTWHPNPDNTYPNEPWSEWRYNDYGGHKDTSNLVYKQFPLNPSPGTIIKGDTTYYFTAWSLDNSGNWSAATQAQIHVPKNSVDVANVVTKEARFQANSGGSWRTATGFQGGDLIQQKSPRSQGLFFYGNQITDAVGTSGATITVKAAQIYIRREGTAEDNGAANANVYLFWTPYKTAQDLPNPGAAGDIVRNELTKIGSGLAKGQGKWFDLPDSYLNNLNTGIKGMGLAWKDPVKADAAPNDYSRVVAVGQNLRCGELHITWEEKH